MFADLLTSQAFTRASATTLTTKVERGVVSKLMFVVTGTSFRKKDRITVKLRHSGGTIMVIDRIPASDLVLISDYFYGVPAFGSVYAADQSDAASYAPQQIPVGYEGPNPAGLPAENESNGKTTTYVKNALVMPVGNIFLGQEGAELEISIETSQGGSYLNRACHWNVYAVDDSTSSAHVLQWDTSYDLESQQKLVRSLWLVSKENKSLFPSEAAYGTATYTDFIGHMDVRVQLDLNGTNSKNVDLLGLGALTSLFGELGSPANNLVLLMQDNDNLPSDLYLKVTGDDRDKVYIIAQREVMLPGMTVSSQHELVKSQQTKMEQIEQKNPEQARAYIAAGVSPSSTTLAAVKEQLPAPAAA